MLTHPGPGEFTALRERSAENRQVGELLRTARQALGLSVAFLSRMDGTHQHIEILDSALPLTGQHSMTNPVEMTFCQAVMDGRLPPVIPDMRVFPEAMELPGARLAHIRSFVSVPVVLSDGSVYGTFCAAGLAPDDRLSPRDLALMEVLAQAASVIIEPGLREQERLSAIERRIVPVIAGGGPTVLLQPIVDLATRRRTGAEALSRFPQEWRMPPDACFAEANSIGERHRLELLALRRAADHLPHVSGYVSMNVSPSTVLTRECGEFLDRLPLNRVVLELSEHDPVEDYDALKAALAPLRARGMQLAIDDVGAGFSSLRHIVITAPDVIKLDRSIVAGIADDTVLSVVTHALAELAGVTGARLVAEGIETEADATALEGLGVDLGQGWHFGAATTVNELSDYYRRGEQRSPVPAHP
ncbi:EAL domain-containing protein (putative c-di-GMP-specific phosphodiesterase class I) [Krasilnikovia cinnamomea]|uniref:EAL domain-containing protein (Putative c-di-GMP-specific phosphodiesterase class I) n=1 Tax=Krasilnikovia cinnamomea TaxID=349313 RepID=A0A4Q7ZLF5_9ACTN|nr:EAL domain-containing protein [Krasilnikovia cinnamomea]RZU51431.1 EAL domain-containing protein (putative c-di-GMP-specific phosphodiesterase class I) [Krasilnikovia cinnamomea]